MYKTKQLDKITKAGLKKKIFKSIGFNPSKKTILLTSHWTSRSNHRLFHDKIAASIIRNFPNNQLIITSHPKLWQNPQIEYLINKRCKTPGFDTKFLKIAFERFSLKPNVNLQLNIDPIDLLPFMEVCISDYSSVILDSVFFYIPTINRARGNMFDIEIEDLISNSGSTFLGLQDLNEKINNYLKDPKMHKSGREKMVDKFIYNSGEATKRICDILCDFTT